MNQPDRPRCDETPAWRGLQHLWGEDARGFDVRHAFQTDASRF